MKHAFTLIELLVVITIIVVLLAMLTPALNQAIYQAKLAACGAQMRTVAMGVTDYAMENKRFYPYRKALPGRVGGAAGPSYLVADVLQNTELGNGTSGYLYDDRPALMPHFGLDALVDPLGHGNDYSKEANSDGTVIICNYLMLWDVAYTNRIKGGKGSTRMGRGFEWEGRKFNVMLADQVLDNNDPQWTNSSNSHPDEDDILIENKFQNSGHPLTYSANTISPMGSQALGINLTGSWWSITYRKRGPTDNNFAMNDGSVRRFNDVPFDVEVSGYPGMRRIPAFTGSNTDFSEDDGTFVPGGFFQVPPR